MDGPTSSDRAVFQRARVRVHHNHHASGSPDIPVDLPGQLDGPPPLLMQTTATKSIELQSGSSSLLADEPVAQQEQKPLSGACEACRRIKMRCIRDEAEPSGKCNRCLKGGKECYIPLHKPVGRKKGSRTKKPGTLAEKRTDEVERAILAIERHLKKARTDSSNQEDSILSMFSRQEETESIDQSSPVASNVSGDHSAPVVGDKGSSIQQSETSAEASGTFSSALQPAGQALCYTASSSSAGPSQTNAAIQPWNVAASSASIVPSATYANQSYPFPSEMQYNGLPASADYMHRAQFASSGGGCASSSSNPSKHASNTGFGAAGVAAPQNMTNRPLPPNAAIQTLHGIGSKGGASISNPLGLLADASETTKTRGSGSQISPSAPNGHDTPLGLFSARSNAETIFTITTNTSPQLDLSTSKDSLIEGLAYLLEDECDYEASTAYFAQTGPNIKRDLGHDLDPIDLGLVTLAEAQELFPIYFSTLNSIMGILDEALHTPDFCRNKSALLFTWVLVLAAQTIERHAVLSRRLRVHGERLANHALTASCRSVEVVQGLYLSLVCEAPSHSLAEERTWLYTSHALAIAIDLGLNQKCPTSFSPSNHGSKFPSPTSTPQPEASDQENVLRNVYSMQLPAWLCDDLNHTDSRDLMVVQRLARNRERTYLRTLLWERAHAAACGRVSAFPDSDLTLSMDSWWTHPLALDCDRATSAFINLRRLLAMLNTQIKNQLFHGGSSSSTDWVRNWIDSVLDPWCRTWLGVFPSEPPQTSSAVANLHLHYVYRHGRLWTMSFALHGMLTGTTLAHTNHTDGIKQDCLKAAVQCCESAVKHLDFPLASQLHIVSFTMVAYAAIFLLKLLPFVFGPTNLGSQASALGLVAHVGRGLVKVGSESSFKSKATLYGQHLLLVAREKAKALQQVVDQQLLPSMPPPLQQSLTYDFAGENAFSTTWANDVMLGRPFQDTLAQYADLDFNFGDQSSFASILQGLQPTDLGYM